MPQRLKPIVLRDWSPSVNDSVADALLSDNVLRKCVNAYTDESDGNNLGDVKSRKGYTRIGSQIQSGKTILGLTNFIDKTGTPTRLIATVNNAGDTNSLTYYYDTTLGWTQIGTIPLNWTASLKMRFETFLDYVFAVNGTDAVKTWDGTPATDWGTNNATAASVGSLIRNFYDRINIAGVAGYPSRVYYSSFPTAGGAITWSGAYLELNPDDNDSITALEQNSGLLLAFKKRSLYTWNGTNTQGDKIIDVGTFSQESVQTIKGMTFFAGETKGSMAIFLYTGQYPIDISRPIRKWIERIAQANYNNIGSWQDEDAVYFSVGDITYEDGISYSNVCLRFCVSKQTWSVYSLANNVKLGTARVDDSGNRSIVIGDTNGQVHQWLLGNTDNGTTIFSQLQTKKLEFGSKVLFKTLRKFAVYSENPQGATVRIRVDSGKWHDVASLKYPVQIIETNLRGHYFEIMISFTNDGITPFTFDGLEFFDIEIEDYVR